MSNVDIAQIGKMTGRPIHWSAWSKLAGVGVALAVLSGCASISPKTPEQAVTERANSRWKAIVKRDFSQAYQYNAPGYRAAISEENHAKRRGQDVQIIDGEVDKVTCDTNVKCDVRIKVTATAALLMRTGFPRQLTTYADEVWILEDGQWWIFEKI